MTNESLPRRLPVPEWERAPERPSVETPYGALTLEQMAPDDVYIEGDLTYRGHVYSVRWEHTTLDGTPKGYAYNGRDYGPLEHDWQRRRFFRPEAPKTYVGPLLDAVRQAVATYLAAFELHAAASLHAHLVQDQNRVATDYNRKADELAEILAEYEAVQGTLDT